MNPSHPHYASPGDRWLRARLEAGDLAVEGFDHRSHLRVGYVYLCEMPLEAAVREFRSALVRFLCQTVGDEARYHETMTQAWLLAVHHFMEETEPCRCAQSFLIRNPELLNPSIMLTHYSPALLHSETAHHRFIEPDLQPIPPETGARTHSSPA